MIDPRWRKVWRDLRLHPARTLLVVIAIAAGLAGAGAVLNAWALVQRVTREQFLASNPASAVIRTDSVDDALLERVRAFPGIAAAEARRTVFGSARTASGWSTALLVARRDFGTNRIGAIAPTGGSFPPPEGALVIERSSLGFAGAAVGEPIGIIVGGRAPVELPVEGVARDVGVAPGWMDHVVYAFATPSTLARLGAPPSLDELLILVDDRARDRAAVRRLAYDVKAVLERSGHKVFDIDVPEPGEHVHAAQMDSLLVTQGAFGVLALVLCCFVVVNLITATMAGQVREIGVMKTLGARPGQLAAMYLGMAAVIGLVAAAIGLPVAAGIGRSYAALKAELLNFELGATAIPLWVVCTQIAAGVLLPVVAAAWPVTRACRLAVGAALRDYGLVARAGTTGALLTGISGVGRPFLLSLRNAFRRRQRVVLTLLALATGGAVFLGALNLRTSIRGAVALLYRPLRFELVLRFREAWPAERLEAALRAIPGVRAAEAWGGAAGALPHGAGVLGDRFAITAPPPGSALLVHQAIEGRFLTPGDSNALVVTRQLLRDEPDVKVGAHITVAIAGQETRWSVIGVVSTGPGTGAYAPRDRIAALVGQGRVATAVVATDITGEGATLEWIGAVRSEMEQRGFAVQSSQLLTEGRRAMEDHLLLVADFLGVMAWVMILVGGLGLASTMGIAVLERTREIGVLRAIGARHASILWIVQAEGLVIAVVSWLIAIPVAAPVSVILGIAFGRIMIPVPVTAISDGSAVLTWLAMAVVVSLVACAWPSLRALRVTPREALAYE
jgi:putative ABC transport system permease protein